MNKKTDIIIVGCGVGGLFCALNLPKDKRITIITKDKVDKSSSYLAQGGICVLRSDSDFDLYFEDTMRAGHYENNTNSVRIMINSSREIISDLVALGTNFEKGKNGDFIYTKEGAHSRPRILFHGDETGREITSHLVEKAKKLDNITILESNTMIDLLARDNTCLGIVAQSESGELYTIRSDYTILATGGIGGLFEHSTNYPHITGDGIAVSLKNKVKLSNIDYIQIHPTTLYTKKKGRAFLISESVRGEGAVLLNCMGERFVDELKPRDVVTAAIFKEMERTNKPHVWLSLANISEEKIKSHFPNIYKRCLEEGYDITKESIPVVPAQHYFMGGIAVNDNSGTSMNRLYAVGETACNGVHGKNRLASNSLLESMVFAKRAAKEICAHYSDLNIDEIINIDENSYKNWKQKYKATVLCAIDKEKKRNE